MSCYSPTIESRRKANKTLHSQPTKLSAAQWDILYTLCKHNGPIGYIKIANDPPIPHTQETVYHSLQRLVTKNLVIEIPSGAWRKWQITLNGIAAMKGLIRSRA